MAKRRLAKSRSDVAIDEDHDFVADVRRRQAELANQIAGDPRYQAIERAMADLQEASQRIVDAADTENGRGWVRLIEDLERSALDPVIGASPGASAFLAVVTVLARDCITDERGDQGFLELRRVMSISGKHREREFDYAAIRKRVEQLIGANMPKVQAYQTAANQFGCSVGTVRRVVTKK